MLPDKQDFKDTLMEGFRIEYERYKPLFEDKKIHSIYFGGGTPALFNPGYINEILSWFKNKVADCEITLEANPDVISYERLKEFKLAGINRVSVGIQSFNDALLKHLGRTHDAKKAIDSLLICNKSGIENVSIDLMYDIPYQVLEDWKDTLNIAVKLPITHLSLYNLTIEPHTLYYKKQKLLTKSLPSQEESLEMYKQAIITLEKAQLNQYEISAFAKNGLISKHNIGYWTARPFLGFGPSAFSYYEGKRFRNIANLSKYYKLLKSGLSPVDFEEKLDYKAHLKELLTIGIRVLEGVDLLQFDPLEADTIKSIEMLCNEGFVSLSNHVLKLTQKGVLFYDSVAVELI